jgi:hypothetical protein
MRAGKGEISYVELDLKALDEIHELALRHLPTKEQAALSYRQIQQILTIAALRKYLLQFGIEPQFSIKVTNDSK